MCTIMTRGGAVTWWGSDIHIYEETMMKSIFANDEYKEDTFRIEITERVKYELMAEQLKQMIDGKRNV